MKINPQYSGTGPVRTRIARGAMMAAILCAGTLTVYSALAQEGAESAALMKGGASAPAAVAKGPMQMTISMAPAPATAAAASAAPMRGPNCVGAVRDATSVTVPLGKSLLVPMPEPVRNRTIGNPAVAQATMVSPQTLYILGLSVGTTNMIVQGRSGACRVIDVAVGADAGGLQSSLQQLMPGERDIHVSTAAGTIVLAGTVSNSQAAQQAVQIAHAYSDSAGEGAGGAGKGAGVLNMLAVTSPQQVMLEVKVAEVSKTLINQMGTAFNIQGGFGSWSGALVSNLLAGVASAGIFNKANNKPFSVAADAQNTDNLVKILAEPNLVTISGQEATFLAGGKIFIPVPQSSGTGTSSITLQEEEFGVALKFTPTVLANGRISLKVAPEVSELSQTGVTLSATNIGGTSILPLITTRRASTTVQMSDGESFAIGGLIKDNASGSLKAIPGVGEVPVLGALFRSTSFQQDRTELIFLITPHLVRPLQTADVPLPTDSFSKPSEIDVYATGNMEGRKGVRKATMQPSNGAAPQTPASAPAPAPQSAAPVAPAAALPAPRAPQPAQAPAPVPAQPEKAGAATAEAAGAVNAEPAPAARPQPQAPAQPQADAAGAARIARIEATAARLAAAGSATPAKPASRATPSVPAAHAQIARASAAPQSTDR
ncbi:bacterial type II and III secretion system family protein [Burkholderia ambifaria AMMD]|uniref:Type II and III secretion system protein n=1 Tax=Burkholderia ambifaria (strain ATCC BAA-244 / DSM 16087 / CCUG 44356 / LMG 19182 / AMMD) TaxID=339670 RepID=Q0B1Y7_BURCM|nr:type II and III secretion system protein family protein [Burkholderia ambifaria]ABI91836.1 type II and III secretion system protein [Burkholderia ambifaria AMMD]AJY25917.1 bacterial type II and III secretion system family protein [Burkholderia ambifaria AMMD]MBR7932475.1 type II and III secretion system protein family protein [Burkholderia ambifaria]PEH70313.1 secretin [Burkholderia ambifaria]QQC08518.1 type II and III secretion system protein family protein [Burkholderia ambifaria]